MKRFTRLTVLLGVILSSSSVWAATYYIDWVSGSDTNDGITKSTPWKRAPGMYGCSDKCLVKRKAGGSPGDQFILKGGVTWPRAALCWDWYFGNGTAASPIYFGVDQTWFSGVSWSRPILDAETGVPNASPEGQTSIMRAYGDGLVVDNFEFKGLAQLSDRNTAPKMLGIGTTSSRSTRGLEVKNCYFHGWSYGGTATKDYIYVLQTGLFSGASEMNLKIHDNVWDGADTTQDLAGAYKGSAGYFYNNYIANLVNGVVGSNIKYAWGNTFKNIAKGHTTTPTCIGNYSFDCTSHANSLYTVGPAVIFNNYFENVGGGVTIWIGPGDNATAYAFNNVSVNDTNQSIQISNYELTTGAASEVHVWNNTLQGPPGATGARISGPSFNKPNLSTVTVRNNHMIGDYHDVNWGTKITTPIGSNNIGMTNAEANRQGYVVTGTYPYAIPDGGITAGGGIDLRSFATGIPSTTIVDAATAALSNTSCGVIYDEINHKVIGPKITSVPRGTKWDVGAHIRSNTPPTNLRVTP